MSPGPMTSTASTAQPLPAKGSPLPSIPPETVAWWGSVMAILAAGVLKVIKARNCG